MLILKTQTLKMILGKAMKAVSNQKTITNYRVTWY